MDPKRGLSEVGHGAERGSVQGGANWLAPDPGHPIVELVSSDPAVCSVLSVAGRYLGAKKLKLISSHLHCFFT